MSLITIIDRCDPDTYKGELSRPAISSYEASNEILGSWWTEVRLHGQAGSSIPRGHTWKRGRERAHSLFLFPPIPSSLSGLSGAGKERWNHSLALSNHWELFLVLIFQDYQWVSGTAGSHGAWMEFITGCRPRAEHKRFSLDILQKETHFWAVVIGLRNMSREHFYSGTGWKFFTIRALAGSAVLPTGHWHGRHLPQNQPRLWHSVSSSFLI